MDAEAALIGGRGDVDVILGSDSGSLLGKSEEKWARANYPGGSCFQPRRVLGESLAASTLCTAVLGAYEAEKNGGRVLCPVSGYNGQAALMVLEASDRF